MTLGQLLTEGGWSMWPIYFCSVVAFVLVFQRFLAFRSIRDKKLLWLDAAFEKLAQNNPHAAIQQLQQQQHPIARVLLAMLHIQQKRPDRIEAEAQRVGNIELQKLENYLPHLAFLTELSPMLGLFGTVVGMVTLFYALQTAGTSDVNVALLASGIWQALLTTVAGLVVAIPTLVAHLYFTNRLDQFRAQLSDVVQRFLNTSPHAESLQTTVHSPLQHGTSARTSGATQNREAPVHNAAGEIDV